MKMKLWKVNERTRARDEHLDNMPDVLKPLYEHDPKLYNTLFKTAFNAGWNARGRHGLR